MSIIEYKIVKNSMYALSNAGMCYPGAKSTTKHYYFKSVCQPTLYYGIECLDVGERLLSSVHSAQGAVVKNISGLDKRAHDSALLEALNIDHASDIVKSSTSSLFKRICATDSPTRDLCTYILSNE